MWGGGGRGYGVLGLRQRKTCHKVPLQDNFLDDDILHWLLWVRPVKLCTHIYISCTYKRQVIDNECQFVLQFNINAKGYIKLHLPLTFQGIVSRDRYFFSKFKHFSQHFLCMRWWFSRSFDFPQCRPLIGARMGLSQAAYGMILQNHRRLPVCIFSDTIPLKSYISKKSTHYFVTSFESTV